jgi:succinate dehydrogenase/fumarate reductase flavoprotein subunit
MQKSVTEIDGIEIPVYGMNTVIVGSGAAGLNAADSLYSLGQRDIGIVTEGLGMGTSANTGSDKQTYYKLTLAGGEQDSVLGMAETLFSGGAMHGDIALVEAALSARCFFKLVEAGVPFPHDGFGQYAGYKTDHDPRQRATSAGPLTSQYMVSALAKKVKEKGISVLGISGYRPIN